MSEDELAYEVAAKASMHGCLITSDYPCDYKLDSRVDADDDPLVKKIILEEIEKEGLSHHLQDYRRTDAPEPPEKLHRGYLQLFGPPTEEPICDETAFLAFIKTAWEFLPKREDGSIIDGTVIPPDVANLSTIDVRDSSEGYFPFATFGSKKGGVVEAATIVCIDVESRHRTVTPYKMSPKLEVVKIKGKKRTIQVQSLDEYLVTIANFGSFISNNADIEGGQALGASIDGTLGVRLCKRLNLSTEKDPLGELMRRGLHTSDKTSWEALMGLKAMKIVLMMLLCGLDLNTVFLYSTKIEAVIANILWPIFGIKGNLCGMATGKIPSGHGLTTLFNCLIHTVYKNSFIAHCAHGPHSCLEAGQWKDYRMGKEVELLSKAVVMGDDFIGINTEVAELYDRFVDANWGSKTETEVGDWDKMPFLQLRFTMEYGHLTMKRDLGRMVGKLMGPRAMKMEAKMAQAVSMAQGYNDYFALVLLRKIYGRLREYPFHEKTFFDELGRKGVVMSIFPSWTVVRAFWQPNPRSLQEAANNSLTMGRYNISAKLL